MCNGMCIVYAENLDFRPLCTDVQDLELRQESMSTIANT